MVIKTIDLRFYELSKQTQDELKKHIKNNYEVANNFKKKLSDEDINRLFKINNAGISIDVFCYMI